MSKQHSWKDGFRLGLDSILVGNELDQLKDRDGNIDVDAVWKKAQNPKSAMHKGFTWDKDAAALKCWRNEARYILRHIVVLHDNGPLAGQVLRAYVSVNNDGYRAIEPVLRCEDARAALVETVLNRYLSLKNAYQHISELAELHHHIDVAAAKWQQTKTSSSKPTT